MTRRNTTDPLVRRCLDVYGINFLRVPREDADIGDIYIDKNAVVLGPVRSERLFNNFSMPLCRRDERFQPSDMGYSRALNVDIGVDLLGRFLAFAGAIGIENQVKGRFRRYGAEFVRISLKGGTRDYVGLIDLYENLSSAVLKDSLRTLVGDGRLYLTVGVVRTASLSIVAENGRGEYVNCDVDAIMSSAKISIERATSGTYESMLRFPVALAIGVELVELKEKMKGDGFLVGGLASAKDIRDRISEDDERKAALSYIGDGLRGDIFFDAREVNFGEHR